MEQFGKWIDINKKKPPLDKNILIAVLREFANSRSYWTIHMTRMEKNFEVPPQLEFRGIEDGDHYYHPNYWMPIPEPPQMTKKQQDKSEQSFQKDREERINRTKEELERVTYFFEN